MKKKEITKTNRIEWIDTLRGLAMFFVIWGHYFPGSKWFIRKYIYSFHMPLFFLITGLTYKNDNMTFKEFIKKRAKSLLMPYFIINVIALIIREIMQYIGWYKNYSLVKYGLGIFIGNNQILPFATASTWFILTLFIVEVLFFFIKKVSSNEKSLFTNIMVVGVLGYITSLVENQIAMPWHITTAFTGVVFYYIGFMFMKNIDKFKSIFESNKKMFLYGLILGIIGFVSFYFNGRVSMHLNLYGDFVLFYLSSLCTSFGLILFVNLFMKKSLVFKNSGKQTLFYLGYHFIFIRLFDIYCKFFLENTLTLFIGAALIFAICFVLSNIAYKYAPILVGKLKK